MMLLYHRVHIHRYTLHARYAVVACITNHSIVHTFLIAIMYWYVCRLWTVHSIGQQNQSWCAIVGTTLDYTLVVYNP